MSEGKSKNEVQFWLNIVEITGIFEELENNYALQLGSSIVQMWNYKLKGEGIEGMGEARLIHDKDTEEIFVTVDQLALGYKSHRGYQL